MYNSKPKSHSQSKKLRKRNHIRSKSNPLKMLKSENKRIQNLIDESLSDLKMSRKKRVKQRKAKVSWINLYRISLRS